MEISYDQMTIEELNNKKEELSNEIKKLYEEIDYNTSLMQDKYISYIDKRELENESVYFQLQINRLYSEIDDINTSISNRVVRKLSNS